MRLTMPVRHRLSFLTIGVLIVLFLLTGCKVAVDSAGDSVGDGGASGGDGGSQPVSAAYVVAGTVVGYTGGGLVLNNGGTTLPVAVGGGNAVSFAFGPYAAGTAYAISVQSQPAGQTCAVSNGSGTLNGANVANVVVNCIANAANTYSIGGTVSGLASGNTVVLQNGDNNFTVALGNGSFTFGTAVANGSTYAVTVLIQPTTPNQTCTLANANGTVSGANVTNVTVNCVTSTYTVGGSVSGHTGSGLVLRNGETDLPVTANGGNPVPFTFGPYADGSTYAVSVQTQPAGQTCTVGNGSGTLNGVNVTNVAITCAAVTPNTYSIGGTVSGLASGNYVVLQNSNDDIRYVSDNGAFIFGTPVANGASYAVTVLIQPTTPNQTCVVTNGSGTVSGANVTNVTVACTTNTYAVSGTVTGYTGSGLVLANGATLPVTADGGDPVPFTFGPYADGTAYAVSVQTQPGGQSCTVVSNGSGTLNGANVTNVAIHCADVVADTYTIGGTVSGLANGSFVVLQNNAGDDKAVTANGSFTFSASVANGGAYAITVLTQPTNPSQVCTVTNGSGTVSAANVTNVTVTCATNTYTVGGSVTGYVGSGLVLSNGGAQLPVTAGGGAVPFTFGPYADGSAYAVSVHTQPANQTCTVNNASGVLGGANVTNVGVSCSSVTYTVGGTVTNLNGSNLVALLNIATSEMVIVGNGDFTFAIPVAHGIPYAVTALYVVPVSLVPQTCSITNGSGTMSGPVTNVAVDCGGAEGTYSIGGTVSGLLSGRSVVLQNGVNGHSVTVSANGGFAFSSTVPDGSGYNVYVLTQPQNQYCEVDGNSTGTVSGGNVTDIGVTCLPVPDLNPMPGIEQVALSWNDGDFSGVTFNLCHATENIGSYVDCLTYAGGTVTSNVGASPYVVTGLLPGTRYWFQLEADHGGAETYSASVDAVPVGGLNDTGITLCGDDAYGFGGSGTHNNDIDCAAAGATASMSGTEVGNGNDPVPAGQDAHYGRDARYLASSLQKTGGGAAGFDYTKICMSGEVAGEGSCPADPALGTGANQWACTRDNVTGLIWEVKTDDGGLRDKDWLYTWYNTDTTTNGSSSGGVGTNTCGGTLSGYSNQCNTRNYVLAVNALSGANRLCGATDWRMPYVKELEEIVHLGAATPAIDATYFPNTPSVYPWWSGTTYASTVDTAWGVAFDLGGASSYPKSLSTLHIRLVRGVGQ